MANPQTENGHVKIANDLYEAMTKAGLNGAEFACLLAIIRKTYGWNKKTEQISLNELAELTGVSRRSCARALDSLEQKHMVVRRKSSGETTSLGVQKDYEKWRTSDKNDTSVKSGTSDKSDTRSSDRSDTTPSVKNGTPTNKRHMKDKKDRLVDERYQPFLDAFFQAYHQATGIKPTIRAADGKNLKRMLKERPELDAPLWGKCIDSALKEKFFLKQGKPLSWLASNVVGYMPKSRPRTDWNQRYEEFRRDRT